MSYLTEALYAKAYYYRVDETESSVTRTFREFVEMCFLDSFNQETELLRQRLETGLIVEERRLIVTKLYELAKTVRYDKPAWRFYVSEPNADGTYQEKETELESLLMLHKRIKQLNA